MIWSNVRELLPGGRPRLDAGAGEFRVDIQPHGLKRRPLTFQRGLTLESAISDSPDFVMRWALLFCGYWGGPLRR
jgi:hypothetical protein